MKNINLAQDIVSDIVRKKVLRVIALQEFDKLFERSHPVNSLQKKLAYDSANCFNRARGQFKIDPFRINVDEQIRWADSELMDEFFVGKVDREMEGVFCVERRKTLLINRLYSFDKELAPRASRLIVHEIGHLSHDGAGLCDYSMILEEGLNERLTDIVLRKVNLPEAVNCRIGVYEHELELVMHIRRKSPEVYMNLQNCAFRGDYRKAEEIIWENYGRQITDALKRPIDEDGKSTKRALRMIKGYGGS